MPSSGSYMDLSSGYASGMKTRASRLSSGTSSPERRSQSPSLNAQISTFGLTAICRETYIGPSVKNMRRSEGTDPRPVALNRSKVINLCVFKKFTNSFRKNSSFLYDCGFRRSFFTARFYHGAAKKSMCIFIRAQAQPQEREQAFCILRQGRKGEADFLQVPFQW